MPNIFKRISDVLAANLNDLIDCVEDPERMVKQIIREMEDNIRIAEEGVIDAIASEKQLQKDLEHHRQQAATWRQRADEARDYLDQTMTSLQAGFDASDNFTRMEDRVSEMEAKIAARAELRRDKTRLEREFHDLEVAKEVENELATLRKKMLEEPQA